VGLRYDYRDNKGKGLTESDGTVRFAPFNNTSSNLSFATGYTHEFNDHLNFKANTGTAFRAPNTAELGSNGVHEGTFRYEVGNPNLSPERSYQADATLQYESSVVTASVGIYNNYIHNFIYAANTAGDNISVTDDNGNTNLYPVYRYRQVDANLYGAEASLMLHPVSFIHIDNTFGYTHAQNTTLNRPLSFIPAGTIHNTLRYEPTVGKLKDSYISIGLDNFFAQNRFDAAFETPTSAYTLIDASVGTTITWGKQKIRVYAAVNNLTDKKYYDALSRLKPGRLDQTDPGCLQPRS